MTEELREAVERIKAGDTVTARFQRSLDSPDYIVTGVASNGWAGALFIGHDYLVARDGSPWESLVAIESHEPAKPPAPREPDGDVAVLDDDGRHWWQKINPDGIHYWTNNDIHPGGYVWEDLELHDVYGPFKVYRPEPSPERIEELIRKHLNRWCDDGDVVQATLRGFVADLLGGA
jgi:hypothetical protein